MDFGSNMRRLGHCDTGPYEALLRELTSWTDVAARAYHVHAQSHHLPFKGFDIRFGKVWPEWARIEPIVRPVHELLRAFGPGYINNCNFALLPAGAVVAGHVDNGFVMRHSHRVHIPIFTNGEVEFTVGDESLHMKPGEIWEINNCRKHAVRNGGPSDRIHFMIDWMQALTATKRVEWSAMEAPMLYLGPYLPPEEAASRLAAEVVRAPSRSGPTVQPGCVVGIRWSLSLSLGGQTIPIERNPGHPFFPEGQPLRWVFGFDQVSWGLERLLLDAVVGDTVRGEYTLPPAAPELRFRVPLLESHRHRRKDVYEHIQKADGAAVEPGMWAVFEPHGRLDRPAVMLVVAVEPDAVVLDGNHPFSGKTLSLTAEVAEIRPADEDETRFGICPGPPVIDRTALGRLTSADLAPEKLWFTVKHELRPRSAPRDRAPSRAIP